MTIAASLRAADPARLAAEVLRANRAAADWLHFDAMDGQFVPDLAFGPATVRALRRLTRMKFDVHLLCSRPEALLEAFAAAGADHLTVHVELGERVMPLLWKIRALGLKAGLAINPPTAVAALRPFLAQVDQIVIMTVNPGLAEETFIHETVPKIQQAHEWRQERNWPFRIGVEGGIDLGSARECAAAGADILISGSALFHHRQMRRAVHKMRQAAKDAAPVLAPISPQEPAVAGG